VIEHGIHTISSDTYHADPGKTPSLTASIANKLVNESPLHAWTAHPRLNPDFKREEKTTFDIGTVVHSIILEGDASGVEVVHADDWRTKVAKEQRDEARAAGKIPMLAKDMIRAVEMATAVRDQIAARDDDPPLFSDGKPEQTLVWEERGITCRARLDWLRDDFKAIDDAKTTGRSANPVQWTRNTLWQIGADIQMAFYLRGVKKVTGVDATFRYVLIENQPPYAIAVVSPAPSALEIGTAKVERAIASWRECLRTDVWPGYPAGIYYAETPPWQETQWMELDAEALAA
jgi:hypothetical protein